MKHKTVKLTQCKMHYVEHQPESGDYSETLVFLHGFPEAWFAWKNQLDYFSKYYRVIAPDLPGYNLSEKITDISFYQVPNLIQIIREFIESIANSSKVVLVAHDWGGAIAWPLAAFHPELFSKLVILNAAHPSTFTREMIHNQEQRRKSDYIHELVDENAVGNLQQDNFSYLQRTIWEGMSGCGLTKEDKQQYINAWSEKGSLECMLRYYQAMPQLAPPLNASEESVSSVTGNMKIPNIRIQLPTLVLWGEKDEAFVINVLDGLNNYVTDLTIHQFEQATHWLHHEIPEEVNRVIEGWLF